MDENGWNLFDAGVIKIHTLPKEGESLGKEQYKGFIIRFMWWFPISKA